MAKNNPFDKFVTETKTAHIDSLDYDITYRELTMAESDAFNKRLIKGYDKENGAEFDMNEATQVGYEKIELCLIDPKMTAEDLKKLGTSATKAINEILKVIEGGADDMVDKETGNSED